MPHGHRADCDAHHAQAEMFAEFGASFPGLSKGSGLRPIIGMDDSSGVQRETGNPNVIGAQGEIDPVEIIKQDEIAKAPADKGQEK